MLGCVCVCVCVCLWTVEWRGSSSSTDRQSPAGMWHSIMGSSMHLSLHRVCRAPGPHINGLLTRLAFQCDMGCFDSVLCNRRLVEFWERCEAAPCVVL